MSGNAGITASAQGAGAPTPPARAFWRTGATRRQRPCLVRGPGAVVHADGDGGRRHGPHRGPLQRLEVFGGDSTGPGALDRRLRGHSGGALHRPLVAVPRADRDANDEEKRQGSGPLTKFGTIRWRPGMEHIVARSPRAKGRSVTRPCGGGRSGRVQPPRNAPTHRNIARRRLSYGLIESLDNQVARIIRRACGYRFLKIR